MAEQGRAPALRDALESYLREEAHAARRRRREAGRPGEADGDGAHALQFDESGFPIRQDGRGIVRRIGQRLNPF